MNFSLKTLADSFAGRNKEEATVEKIEENQNDNMELVCTKHKEEPKWFCEVEQRAVCHVCEFPAHHGHTVIPIQQAVKDLKEKLASDLLSLNKKEETCKDIQKKYSEIVQYSKKQLVFTEEKIRGQFEKLHQFLKDEEEARLAALRKEEEEKGKTITIEMKNIQDQMNSLTESITAVEQELQKQEVSFLQSYKDTQTRLKAQYKLPEPQLISGALIDEAKHLGNLQFRVWEKMQEVVKYTPVILDPNTASYCLSLSDDLTRVKYSDKRQQLPDNPERNTNYVTVLGSKGFSSGRHSWDVEVGDHPVWRIGVADESVNRKDYIYLSPRYGIWALKHDHETFREPVSLGCHHSFCSRCLDDFWSQAENKNCPICKRRSSKDNTIISFSLKTLADSFAGKNKEEAPVKKSGESKKVNLKLVCTKHRVEPIWFCEVEQRAVCHVCEFPAHHGHTVIPIQQAVKDLKEKLASDLLSLNKKEETCKDIQKKYSEIVQYSKKQLVFTEEKIRGQFEKLHQFLKDEEEARLAALRKEEEEKGKTITIEMKNIQDQMNSLTESITAVEQELQKQEVSFLQSYKDTQTRLKAQYKLPEPQLISGALIDEAKHLGNLQFRVWEKMQEVVKYTPVILDPNTASCCLSLSDDLTSVKLSDKYQQLPDNPERNTKHSWVLGSEGFSSGRHSWEVEVGDHPVWRIGVANESVNRKDEVLLTPENGIWALVHNTGTFINVLGQTITLMKRPQRIRVHLDYNRGEVSFYDPEDRTHIYTHTDSFKEKLFPFFGLGEPAAALHPDILCCHSEVSVSVKTFD
ncbi:hypothetical protein DPEC_G00257540 [Dallia pectoralis]|uniref:Uncharacterized protein n=1 Tax=Dallia pectoralis TaxID=75939 RepID=A0ACC2FQL4_DALPE|nr:hypothetical protein DPEC_G00257540 [Dallia pectoralis]